MKGCIRTTVHHGRMGPLGNTTQIDEGQIATLRFEQEVDGVFACVRKERQISRAGTPYLTIELRDSTGTIRARAFRDADVLAGRFEQGELVRVHGRVERFRDELQIALGTIARADGIDADPARFLPTAYRDLDELEGFLEHLAREVYEPGLKGLLARLLGDEELRAEIRRAPCSLPVALGSDSKPRRRRRRPLRVSSRLSRRPARAHRRGCHDGARALRAASAPGSRSAAERGDRPRPGQDPRVHLRRGDRAQPRGSAAGSRRAGAASDL